MSLETNAKVTPTLVFPNTMHRCESWTVNNGKYTIYTQMIGK